MKDPTPYKEEFPAGTEVRVADRPFLEEFMITWKYHHKLQPMQLDYADCTTRVKGVAFYHGGDPVYTLDSIPGQWLAECLRPARGRVAQP